MPDLAAVAAHPAAGLLTPELAAFVEGGRSLTVAVRDADGWPISSYGVGVRVGPGGRLRLLMRRPGQEEMLMALMRDPRIAATVTEPSTHRSIQFKGADASISAPSDDDRRAAADQARRFAREIEIFGYPPGFPEAVTHFDPADLVAIDFTPTSAFSQTPGPGAGEALP